MAAVAGTDTVNITINDVEIQVPKGELIVEAVKRLGLEIPIFCYHPRMKPVGMCRMCLVEVGFKQPDGSVRKMPKPQAGCTLPASEGMVVYTDSEMVHADRKGVLEFLLVNHPLDCPICDRGGECPLQNNTLFYGPSTSRFTELKRHLPKAFPLSQYVTLDLERCIQCGRCVRFTEEISGDSQLAFRFRGASMQPSTFKLTDFESKFSGNVIEICPVGALTSAKYRFRARPWDLETKPALCTVCSNGCNVWFDHRAGKFVRLNGRTNEAVNEEWTCDKGKFGQDFYNSPKRLKNPLVRQGEGFAVTGWAEAYEAVLGAFQDKGAAVAGLTGGMVANEGLYLFGKLFREVFGSENLDSRWTRHLAGHRVANTIADFENLGTILVFGTSLADEQPILHLRVRKAWFKNGAKVIVANDRATDADSFAHAILRYRTGTHATLAGGLLQAVNGSVSGFDKATVLGETGVSERDFDLAVEALKDQGPGVITSQSILNLDRATETLDVLGAIGSLSCYALRAGDTGAALLGLTPGPGGKDTHAILEGCASGSIKALWLLDCDPFALHPDKALVTRALENVEFLVVQAREETELTGYASVVLPLEAPAEHDGSYTNMEGRVQRMKPVVAAPGDSKEAWRVFSEVMLRAKPQTPFFNPSEVMVAIATSVPAFAGATYDRLEGEGVVVGLRPGQNVEAGVAAAARLKA